MPLSSLRTPGQSREYYYADYTYAAALKLPAKLFVSGKLSHCRLSLFVSKPYKSLL